MVKNPGKLGKNSTVGLEIRRKTEKRGKGEKDTERPGIWREN